MKKHVKIYLDALGYDECDFISCEITGNRANDIHHIDCRGMGGDPTGSKDRIEELQAVTRDVHIEYGDKKEHMVFLYLKHYEFLSKKGVDFDRDYIRNKIAKYV